MTDRHAGYLVALGRDVREDDAQEIITAIKMIRGVLEVTPVPGNLTLGIAKMRSDQQWVDALLGLAAKGPE